MNPFGEDFAVKPDGTPFKVAVSYIFLACDPMANWEGIIASLLTRAGAEYILHDAGIDAQKQIAFCDDCVTVLKPDAFIMHSVNELLVAPSCDKMAENGILVYSWDHPVPSDSIICYVEHDFISPYGTNVCGEYLVERAEAENKHLYVYHVWGRREEITCQLRNQGYYIGINDHPLITTMESPDTGWSTEVMANMVMDAFTAHPELNAYYQQGAGIAGGVHGLEGAGRLVPFDDPNHVIIATNDEDTEDIEYMEKGMVDAFATHGGWHLGDQIVQCLLTNMVLGQPVPKRVVSPMKMVTYENYKTLKMFGCPAAYPLMPPAQWDLWPALDLSEPGCLMIDPDYSPWQLESPTKAMRMELQGY